jgi:hypothetical protein
LIAVSVTLAGCRTKGGELGIDPIVQYPGFKTFATPRTFDGPGTLFRIDEQGTRFPVAKLGVSVDDAGTETLPSTEWKKTWGLNAVLQYITLGTVSGEASHATTLTVRFGPARRERTFDDDIDRAIVSHGTWKEGSTYYVIRETIAFTTLEYELDRSSDWGYRV